MTKKLCELVVGDRVVMPYGKTRTVQIVRRASFGMTKIYWHDSDYPYRQPRDTVVEVV